MTLDPTIRWRKSSYSNGMGGECIEVAALPADIGLRDSKAPTGPQITVGHRAWGAFVGAIREDGARSGNG
ncbi:DUF397 domain-containing protein [Streptomyces sp. NPDC058471]|uniref:DUF397 domain-containing protein n=1 Tax=Streptomyces sp. NPDC058471 TaxID=3346516 RepID=UPI003655752A